MKGLSTREKIIERSSELFNIYGYHACSLSHIMEATQLKKGGIYNHFKNKDEIAVEAFNYNYNRVINRFREKLDRVNSSYEKLNAVIDAFVSFVDDPIIQGGGCPIFNTAMDSTNTHPELKRKAQEGIQGLKKYIEIKLDEGIKAGEFRPDIKPKQVSTLLVASLEGAIIMSRVDENKECIEYASEYLKGYIRNNLVKDRDPISTADKKKVDRIHNKKSLKKIRKELRNNLTSAEATLWSFLKKKQINGRKFRRQHSIENYIVDFYCPSEKLVIELDGAGHYTPFGDREDFVRDQRLNDLGIKVLRFENEEIFKNIEGVIDVIKSKFEI